MIWLESVFCWVVGRVFPVHLSHGILFLAYGTTWSSEKMVGQTETK